MSKKGLSLKTAKLDNGDSIIYHPESGCVFKSKNEKIVIGRYQDGEYNDLDEETLELCEKHRFTPDMSLVTEETPKVEEESEAGEEADEREPPREREVVVPKETRMEAPRVAPQRAPSPPPQVPTSQPPTSAKSESEKTPTAYFSSVCKDDFDLNLEALAVSYRALKGELSKKNDELCKKNEELAKKNEELAKKDVEIKQLKEKFNAMKQLFA
jgi:hypothetical protein